MPRKGHTEEEIIAALHQVESGEKVAEICRKTAISEATFYSWKKQYAGLGIKELRERRQLRDENGRPKRLVADLSLDRQILQEIVSKKSCKGLGRDGSWRGGSKSNCAWPWRGGCKNTFGNIPEIEVNQDSVDDWGIFDETDDFHHTLTFAADERIHFENLFDQTGPVFPALPVYQGEPVHHGGIE